VDPSSCVILVPVGGPIVPGCEQALQTLERRGYPVRRVPGFSAIDFGRCVMAADALRAGFQELMWVDCDVAFDPDDVEKLRGHGLPFVCGLYAKKGRREFACDFLPGTDRVQFGQGGGLVEVRFAGFGFTLTRREVYEKVQRRLRLPECNQRFGDPIAPWFIPMLARNGPGMWYLAEDYSFCERARLCGYRVMADTTVRLWHVGSYGYSWEDAGSDKERYATYTFHLGDAARPAATSAQPPAAPATPVSGEFTQDWCSYNVPLWGELLAPLKAQKCQALEVGAFEGRTSVWLLENVLTHPESRLTCVDTFEGGSDQAGFALEGLEERFRKNTERFREQLAVCKGLSHEVLRTLPVEQFDFVYVDASHEAPDVLIDAALCWLLLKPRGLLAFDDYEWSRFPEPERRPKPAIDAFLSVLRGRYELLHRGYQLWVRKQR
jgi:predicted O-methyltransferase YrrM